MSKKEIDVLKELKAAAQSADKVTEHTGQFYAVMARLYAAADGNPIRVDELNQICHIVELDYQQFQTAHARVKVMGAAIEQKNSIIGELTEEARTLAKLLKEQAAADSIIPVYTNGHKKGGKR